MQQMQTALETQSVRCHAAVHETRSPRTCLTPLSIGESAFANAFQMNMDENDLTELMMSMMGKEDASYDNNLKKLGYADFNKPSGIDIYPIDFESKEKVDGILDALQRPHDRRRRRRQGDHLHQTSWARSWPRSPTS